jgi:hypothetical protein
LRAPRVVSVSPVRRREVNRETPAASAAFRAGGAVSGFGRPLTAGAPPAGRGLRLAETRISLALAASLVQGRP